jgi:uncharacterized repeat protein (TIGR03847 family)
MPARLIDYDPPERFIAGTVGEPGNRTFFLQARGVPTGAHTGVLISVALEKQQVEALAERVDELLDELMRRGSAVPATTPAELEDLAAMDTPIEEEFRVGTMSLIWDDDVQRVVIECFEVGDDVDDDTPTGTGGDRTVLRVSLPPGVARALALVKAGRPPCPFCAEPLEPLGHVCPRANGYRR